MGVGALPDGIGCTALGPALAPGRDQLERDDVDCSAGFVDAVAGGQIAAGVGRRPPKTTEGLAHLVPVGPHVERVYGQPLGELEQHLDVGLGQPSAEGEVRYAGVRVGAPRSRTQRGYFDSSSARSSSRSPGGSGSKGASSRARLTASRICFRSGLSMLKKSAREL